MDEVLRRAEERRRRALDVIETLGLFERWSRYGSPVIVGSVRLGLVVALDIDMHIYTDAPRIEHGFSVMSKLAVLPGVWKIYFSNELDARACTNERAREHQGLYWQIRYRDQIGDVWKVDNWLMAWDHPHAHWAEEFADAMQKALTDQTRRTILEIKEALLSADVEPRARAGIDIYRAVLEGGVRRPSEFTQWIAEHQKQGATHWRPST